MALAENSPKSFNPDCVDVAKETIPLVEEEPPTIHHGTPIPLGDGVGPVYQHDTPVLDPETSSG